MNLYFYDKDKNLRKVETEYNVHLILQDNIRKFIENNSDIKVSFPILTCYSHIQENQPRGFNNPGPTNIA